MQGLNALKMLFEELPEAIRQNRHPVFIPFTDPDDKLLLKINIFNPQAQPFQQAQPTAIQQASDQLMGPGQGFEQSLGISPAQHSG